MQNGKKIEHSTLASPNAPKSLESLNSDITLRLNDITTLSHLQEDLDSSFAPKRRQSEQLANIYSLLDYVNRAERVSHCGTFLEYHVYSDKSKLSAANFCKDRLCPMCTWRRSLKIFHQVSKCMDLLESQNYQFLFLTLTIKNCDASELQDAVNELLKGWRYLYNKNKLFRTTVKGTFRTLEITRNAKTGKYHPHLHVVLVVSSDYFSNHYVSQKEWQALWRKACNLDYQPVIDVRKIDNTKKAVCEVSKYAVKGTDFLRGSVEQQTTFVSDFLKALTGKRLVSYTGCFAEARKQLNLDDIEKGDLVNVSSDDLRNDINYLIARCQWASGYYAISVLKK